MKAFFTDKTFAEQLGPWAPAGGGDDQRQQDDRTIVSVAWTFQVVLAGEMLVTGLAHSVPPECFVGALAFDDAEVARWLGKMQSMWNVICELEKHAVSGPEAAAFAKGIAIPEYHWVRECFVSFG